MSSSERRKRQQKARERAKAKIAAGEVTAETPEVKSRIVPKGTPDSVLAMRGGPLGNPFGYWGGAGELYTVTGKNETEKIAKVVELHKNWLETGEVPDDVTPENKTKLAALREEQLKTIDNLPDDYKLGYYRPDASVSHAITLENFIEERRKGGTPDVKTSDTQYNVIEPNPRYGGQHGHYIWRTQYNYANSDITFDFTTGGPSGGGNSMGKGTADAMVKWENVLVDNTGKLTATNIDEVAQKLADALTSGQTVNIAGHGNYKSTRQGFPVAVWQSQVDTSMQTIFDRAKELAGDKPFTGKVISGGQSGFDEAGIRVARNLGIPTEVNIQEYTWRDADGDHFNDEQGFKDRIDADSYDSETFTKKIPSGPGTPSIDDPAFNAINEVDQKAGGDGKFARYAIYAIDPISELIEDGAIALAGKMGMPRLAKALRYWMYYEAANLVGTVVDIIPEAANQAALAQLDQSMILGAGIGLIDEKAFNNWKEDLNSATTKNMSEVGEDMYQMAMRSPLTRAWIAFEEKSGLRVPTIFDVAKLDMVKGLFGGNK